MLLHQDAARHLQDNDAPSTEPSGGAFTLVPMDCPQTLTDEAHAHLDAESLSGSRTHITNVTGDHIAYFQESAVTINGPFTMSNTTVHAGKPAAHAPTSETATPPPQPLSLKERIKHLCRRIVAYLIIRLFAYNSLYRLLYTGLLELPAPAVGSKTCLTGARLSFKNTSLPSLLGLIAISNLLYALSLRRKVIQRLLWPFLALLWLGLGYTFAEQVNLEPLCSLPTPGEIQSNDSSSMTHWPDLGNRTSQATEQISNSTWRKVLSKVYATLYFLLSGNGYTLEKLLKVERERERDKE